MKFLFRLIFFCLMSQQIVGNDLESNYLIKTKGVSIGVLNWKIITEEDKYETVINIKNHSLLSKIYSFSGKYISSGKIRNDVYLSKNYYQAWKTKKKKRVVEIKFNKKKITNLKIFPKETEYARLDYTKILNYNDPLASFLYILKNKKESKTTDGRRVYLLDPINKKSGGLRILIKNYQNIWADHKKKDLQYIDIFFKNDELLPKKIKIKFKGSVFTLNKS